MQVLLLVPTHMINNFIFPRKMRIFEKNHELAVLVTNLINDSFCLFFSFELFLIAIKKVFMPLLLMNDWLVDF
jgi:hypothetical protein